jgi:hypothetical protein
LPQLSSYPAVGVHAGAAWHVDPGVLVQVPAPPPTVQARPAQPGSALQFVRQAVATGTNWIDAESLPLTLVAVTTAVSEQPLQVRSTTVPAPPEIVAVVSPDGSNVPAVVDSATVAPPVSVTVTFTVLVPFATTEGTDALTSTLGGWGGGGVALSFSSAHPDAMIERHSAVAADQAGTLMCGTP